MKYLLRPLFVLVTSLVTIWSFLVPDAQRFLYPGAARIFFWHMPCPVLMLGFMFAGIYFSFRVFRRLGKDFPLVELASERREWDVRAESAMELGFVWATLTMATGIIFSLDQWGAMWQWDPRQSSFLLALLIYAAYIALRNAYSDTEKRATLSAAYAMASGLPILFLTVVFPRLPWIVAQSFHPTDTIMKGELKGQYLYVTLAMISLMAILSVWLYRLRCKAGLLELALEQTDGSMENSRRPSRLTGVVRPVILSDESGSTSQGD